MVRFTVEGRPLWVQADRVIAVGTAPGVTDEDGTVYRSAATVVTVDGVGGVPVEESVNDVLLILRGEVPADVL